MEAASKVIHAIYNDDDILMSAVKKVRAEKHHIEETYPPFPVHALDKVMRLAPTRIALLFWLSLFSLPAAFPSPAPAACCGRAFPPPSLSTA